VFEVLDGSLATIGISQDDAMDSRDKLLLHLSSGWYSWDGEKPRRK